MSTHLPECQHDLQYGRSICLLRLRLLRSHWYNIKQLGRAHGPTRGPTTDRGGKCEMMGTTRGLRVWKEGKGEKHPLPPPTCVSAPTGNANNTRTTVHCPAVPNAHPKYPGPTRTINTCPYSWTPYSWTPYLKLQIPPLVYSLGISTASMMCTYDLPAFTSGTKILAVVL